MRDVDGLASVGVVGAGQMGGGIAFACALAGYDVYLHDLSAARIAAGVCAVERDLGRKVRRGEISSQDAEAALVRVRPTEALTDIGRSNLVIEAVAEREDVKAEIFRTLSAALQPGAILASNTSSISITRLAAATRNPEQFIGLHFMNPVAKMKLVEVIRGVRTSQETFAIASGFVSSIGKTIIEAEDSPAFIVNRILITMINEAVYTLYEGVGSVAAIDSAMKLGANQPMGPLQLADFIGLDTVLATMNVLHSGLADSKYRPCPLLVRYAEAGWLGRKTGRGFYDYAGDAPVPTR